MKTLASKLLGRITSVDFLLPQIKDFLMWPIATRILGREYEKVVRLKDGFLMKGSMQDILSRKILFNGPFKKHLWEPATSELLETLAIYSKNILIAGSHMGYLVLLAAKNTKGQVVAFEPEPRLYKASKENFALNPSLDKKIHLIEKALGEKEGEIDLYSEDIRSSAIPYSGGHVAHQNIVRVAVTTIDTTIQTYGVFDLILLDIEGFEWNALNGALEELKSKPKLILEISPRVLSHIKVTPEMIFQKLMSLGYAIYFIDDYASSVPLVVYSEEVEKVYLKRDYVNIYAIHE